MDKHDELLCGPQLHPAMKEDQTTSAAAAIGCSAQEGSDTVSDAAKTWSLMAAGASNDEREWIYPNRHKPKQKTQPKVPTVPIRVPGKKAESTTIQSVPRRAVIVAVVAAARHDGGVTDKVSYR